MMLKMYYPTVPFIDLYIILKLFFTHMIQS